MLRYFSFLLALISGAILFGQSNYPYQENETYTYHALVQEYQQLADQHPAKAYFKLIGDSDYGEPIPLFVIDTDLSAANYSKKNVILINNAIHPGEPCGVDASLKLATDLLANPEQLPKNVSIAFIGMYNIGGAYNRNCCSRTNQVGPKEYGFRGNAKNLDLNRDFIKADSKNTLTFYQIFHRLNPILFVDTHTSNGADYQHTMTLITSQLNKMDPALATLTENELLPYLYDQMEKENFPLVPYVHTKNGTPDNGIMDYLETPRYSTGYTNLFNCISFVTEAHMLKPYEDRVESTYAFLHHLITYANDNAEQLKKAQDKAKKETQDAQKIPINWEFDTTRFDTIPFLGYEARYKPSAVTGMDRLYYDHERPYEKHIRYYRYYTPVDSVVIPDYYIIPQQWEKVALLLRQSGVHIQQLTKDVEFEVETYTILDYTTSPRPYEGHYLHANVSVDKATATIPYRKGDFVIPTRNKSLRMLVETLEPHAADSYFVWNFFDAILQQKEWFSSYVFEDEAARILEEQPELKAALNEKIATDSAFAESAFQQLYFVYKHTPHYETSVNHYPIARKMGAIQTGLLSPW